MGLDLRPGATEKVDSVMNRQNPPSPVTPPEGPPRRASGGHPRYLYMAWADSDESKKLWGQKKLVKFGNHWAETLGFGASAVAVCAILALTLAPFAGSVTDGWAVALRAIQVFLVALALCIAVALGARYSAARRSYYERVKSAKSEWVDQAVNDLMDHPDLPHLMVLNRRQLDDYHLSSVRQQSIAFRNAQIAGVTGFVILIVGAAVSIRQSTQTAQLMAAGLAALGGALSAYVVRVFARSYDRASDEMRVYYLEPFYTHQVLMVERVAGLRALPDEGAVDEKLRAEMVSRMLSILQPLDMTGSASGRQPGEPAEPGSKGGLKS
jgi:hypothetical protein